MQNSNRFLIAYNSIENYMKKYATNDYHVSFIKLLQNAKKQDSVIRRYYSELKDFAELRNAIVHDSFDNVYAIAEPHDKIVEKIEFIEQEIKKPQKVLPLFKCKVTIFQINSSLKDILTAINIFSYSKFPVYEKEHFCGLLTKDGIVNWLASNVYTSKSISYEDISVKDILFHQRNKKNYQFISKNLTVYDVEEIFNKNNNNGDNGKKLEALLITEHGALDEPILGIVTLEDLIKIPKKK